MMIGKLCDGRIVRILKWNVPAPFDTTRTDHVLVHYPVHYALSSGKTNLCWTNTTRVVWRMEIEE